VPIATPGCRSPSARRIPWPRRVGQLGIFLVDGNVLLDAAEHAQLRLDADARAWACSTTRRVMAMFSSNGSCEASIITEL
jgi:hypothetical protein